MGMVDVVNEKGKREGRPATPLEIETMKAYLNLTDYVEFLEGQIKLLFDAIDQDHVGQAKYRARIERAIKDRKNS